MLKHETYNESNTSNFTLTSTIIKNIVLWYNFYQNQCNTTHMTWKHRHFLKFTTLHEYCVHVWHLELFSLFCKNLCFCQHKIKRGLGQYSTTKKYFFVHFLKLLNFLKLHYTNICNISKHYLLSYRVKKLKLLRSTFCLRGEKTSSPRAGKKCCGGVCKEAISNFSDLRDYHRGGRKNRLAF